MIIFEGDYYFEEADFEVFERNHRFSLRRKILECWLWLTDHMLSVTIRTAMAKLGMKLSRKWGY